MKILIYFICAVITTSAFAARPHVQYTDVTYAVTVVHDNGNVGKECLTFHESGRFTLTGETLTMVWAPQVNLSNRFLAVTAPGERTVVPHHQGVYGTVLSDKTVSGYGIDQDGNTFEFHGQANDDCYANRPAQSGRKANPDVGNLIRFPDPCLTADDSGTSCHPIRNLLRALVPDLGNMIRLPDPCLLLDDSGSGCQPIPNPLRALVPDLGSLIRLSVNCLTVDDSGPPCKLLRSADKNLTQSTLAGRSFRLTLGTSDQTVLEYCWTFGQKHQIQAANGDLQTWSPNTGPNYNAGFRSAGAGKNGRGLSFHGALVGDELLEVVGIEARDGVSIATYGFGQRVATCQ